MSACRLSSKATTQLPYRYVTISRVNTRLQTVITLLIGSGVLVICHLLNTPPWMRSFFILFPMVASGIEIGKYLLPGERSALRAIWGFVATLALLILIRGGWFYLGLNLNGAGSFAPEIILFVGLALFEAILIFSHTPDRNASHTSSHIKTSLTQHLIAGVACAISIIACALVIFVAHRAGTEQSIRTPWPLLPEWTLPLIGMQWIFAIVTMWKLKNRWITALQTALAIASTTMLAPFVYRIGYGFDGFLHVAGERILLETGTLIPHPMYYMGQYLLTTWIARIGELDIASVDRYLVPVSASILLPLALLTNTAREHRITRFAGLILIPLAPFVATTPHGFSIVLACTAVLLSVGTEARIVHPVLPILIALWCALTHPLVGLPILGATIALAIYKHRSAWRTALAVLCAIGGSLAVPLMFGLASAIGSSGGVNFDLTALAKPDAWKALASAWIPWVGNRYAIWAETAVWIEKILPWLVILLALSERVMRQIKKEATGPWLTASLGTTISAIILTIAGDFGFLIDYERGNYADRLWLVAWILLLPLAIPMFGSILKRIKNGHVASVAGSLACIGILTASMSYTALPRHDAVTPSRGWSVGLADIEAVKLIDENSDGEPYTVLANQSVSAAAVRTYGFKRYNGETFYYPIPTGGALYETFLKASYGQPTAQTMSEAGTLGGSRLVYFVVNDYWWKADELIELAKKDAVRVFDIQNGKVNVFRYEVK